MKTLKHYVKYLIRPYNIAFLLLEILYWRKGDITHSIANIDKMSKINFKSDYSNFEKQINKTIQWFKEN